MRIRIAAMAALILGISMFVLPGGSTRAVDDIVIPIDTAGRFLTGTTVFIAGPIDSGDLQGRTCAVRSVGTNQESVHENNDLIVVSATSTTLFDVERATGEVTTTGGDIVLGPTIEVFLTVGNDDWSVQTGNFNPPIGLFAGGMDVILDCDPPPPPTDPPVTDPPPPPVDSDGDGVNDDVDVCSETVLPDIATRTVKKNRYIADAVGVFGDSGYTVADTGGCSAAQIIAGAGLGNGHDKFGLSKGALQDWVATQS